MAIRISGTTGIDMGNTSVSNVDVGALDYNAVNKEYADLKQSKSELAYDVNTGSYISNTLASGAIIERGSNTNGTYIKFADGTMICYNYNSGTTITTSNVRTSPIYSSDASNWTFPHSFIEMPSVTGGYAWGGSGGYTWSSVIGTSTGTSCFLMCWSYGASSIGKLMVSAIGRWK